MFKKVPQIAQLKSEMWRHYYCSTFKVPELSINKIAVYGLVKLKITEVSM